MPASQKQLMLARPMTVLTPVISSLAGAVRAYFERVFPPGYFSSRWVDTEMPARPGLSRRRRFRPMTMSQISAWNTPLLTIKVDPTADASDFAPADAWSEGNRFLADPLRLSRLIVDDQAGRFLGVYFERVVCRFGVSLTMNTDMQAYDAMMYLRRLVPVGRRSFLNDVTISTELPPDVLRALWTDLGLGDGSRAEDYAAFQRYLAWTTGGLVDRVVSSATGRNLFSFRYVANPVMSITGTPSVAINRDGAVVRGGTVELALEMDLAVPMSYSYRQDGPPSAGPVAIPVDLATPGTTVFFATPVPAQPPQVVGDGLSLVFRTALVSSPLDPAAPLAADVTGIGPHVPETVRAYTDALRLMAGGPGCLSAHLWMDGAELDPAAFAFDWRAWELTIRLPRHNYQYDLALYCDLAELPTLEGQPPRPQAPPPFFAAPALAGRPYGPRAPQTYS